jgi:uncharacterized UBP type Zn finger protein
MKSLLGDRSSLDFCCHGCGVAGCSEDQRKKRNIKSSATTMFDVHEIVKHSSKSKRDDNKNQENTPYWVSTNCLAHDQYEDGEIPRS